MVNIKKTDKRLEIKTGPIPRKSPTVRRTLSFTEEHSDYLRKNKISPSGLLQAWIEDSIKMEGGKNGTKRKNKEICVRR